MINTKTNLPENAKVQTMVVCSLEDLKDILKECLLLSKGEQNEVQSNKLLSADEVVKILRCNRSTLWRWGKSEYLCPVKVGAKNMYRENEVNDILKNQK